MQVPPLSERWQLPEGYRVELFADQDTVSREVVRSIWVREGVLDPEEAERRLDEVLLVAIDPHDRLAGVTTAYLKRNEQLRADLWYYRAFTPAAVRQVNVAVVLAVTGRQYLEDRFVAGTDRRAIGVIYEVENVGLQRHFPDALWLPTDFLFIGEDERGAHVRVHYFRGANAPEPDGYGSA